ncbi:MAG: IMP dehydrogenase [Candidatus Marinimicrobia bacterium]|nr:IMP dehydrogenase [Candidatus Neomarinimicrobiota bacterium]
MINGETANIVRKYLREKGLPTDFALTFNDVVIVDNFSMIPSRSSIRSLSTPLTKKLFLNIPIVSANMDTVTNAEMAKTMARLGGIGFIHQFMSKEKRVAEIMKVKRADNAFIKKPITIPENATLGDAKQKMKKYGISSLLITNRSKKFVGILTLRDYYFESDNTTVVKSIMTSSGLITALPSSTQEEAQKILQKNKIEKLPLVSLSGDICGLVTTKDIMKKRSFPFASRDSNGNLMVGATIRLNADYLDEAYSFLEVGADVLLLDTGRANCLRAKNATKEIKNTLPDAQLIVGNVDTPEAAYMLIKSGADGLKIGIGPGSACKTREIAGVGIPQLTAIAMCTAVAREFHVPIIADGGIRSNADVGKAIIAGANTIMIGGLLAGTDESPGETHRDANMLWKVYRGSASLEHQLDRIEEGSLDGLRVSEGVPRRIPYSGSVKSVINDLLGGLRSSMSFVGASDLTVFHRKGQFIRQTRAGYEEGVSKK